MSGPSRAPLRLTEIAAPLVLLGILGGGTVVMTVTWVATWVAASVSAAGTVPDWGGGTVAALAEATRLASLDPLIGAHGSRGLFWTAVGVQTAPLLVVLVAVTWGCSARGQFGTAARSLARRRDLRDMVGRGAEHRAMQLRPLLQQAATGSQPSVPGRRPRLDPRDLGMRLGRLGRHDVYASEEDVLLEIAGPRSNKTSALVVPAVLSAVGPVVTTSNKVDVYTLTVGLRAQLGRVFVMDPQRICGAEQTWWWNPLAGIKDMADAQYLVTHFSQTVGAGHERADPYFTKGAERLIGQLFVAAAHSRRNLRDVLDWLATRSETPVGLLRRAGLDAVARGLQGTLEAPPDQRGGLYETALTALGCLESEAVLSYVTPPNTWRTPPRATPIEPIAEFDPWRFLVGYQTLDGVPQPSDTLYLLTREGAGTGAPVVAALVDHLLRTAAQAATARGGRVDPPVRAVLDEAANICPIKNLPDLYSYFGSMSIQAMTWLQSYQQGVHVWGRPGMDKLWSAATIKLIGAGVHDASFCEDLSRLVGEHDVPTWSDQRGVGHRSSTLSTRRDRILAAADIAALPKTTAVLISAGRTPGQLTLLPWYAERDAQQISEYAAEATAAVRTAAIAALGPANPLAQLLERQQRNGS